MPPSKQKRDFLDSEFTIPLGSGDATLSRPGRASSRDRAVGSVVHLSLYRRIATAFIALAVLLLLFVLYISLARATVTIVPKVEEVSGTFELTVAKEPSGELSVPGYVLETVVDSTKTVSVSGGDGAKKVEGVSCGAVKIVNDQSKAQPLVEKTRLLSEGGVLFRLTKTVSVPGKGSLETTACADAAGRAGDIGPSKFTIPGLAEALQSVTYAVSAAAMTGGESVVAVVTEADVQKATDAFAEELATQAMDKLAALVPDEEARKHSFFSKKTVKVESGAKVGTEQSSYTLTIGVHVAGVFYDPMALGQAAGAALRASVGGDKDLLSLDQEHLAPELAAADAVAGKATVKVTVTGTALVRQDGDVFDKGKIAGLKPADAKQYLEALPGVASATVTLTPSWSLTVPNLKDHIDVKIEAPAEPEPAVTNG